MVGLDKQTKKTLDFRYNAETLDYVAKYRAPTHTKQANIDRLTGHLLRINSKLAKKQQELKKLQRIREALEFVPKKKRTVQEVLALDKCIQEINHVKKQIKNAEYHGKQSMFKRGLLLGDVSHGQNYKGKREKPKPSVEPKGYYWENPNHKQKD